MYVQTLYENKIKRERSTMGEKGTILLLEYLPKIGKYFITDARAMF